MPPVPPTASMPSVSHPIAPASPAPQGQVNFAAYARRPSFGEVIRQWNKHSKMNTVVFSIGFSVVLAVAGAFLLLMQGSPGKAAMLILLILGIPSFAWGKQAIAGYTSVVRELILQRFAQDNQWSFTPEKPTADYNGAIFQTNTNRRKYETVVDGIYQGLQFELGNYWYATGSKNETLYYYGVVRIQLSRNLPHILLDAKANNGMFASNLPEGFARSQRLQLEGDFNNYFDLYVPAGYERDALYFITPDLMQLLIDHGAQYDIELVDNCMFIYRRGIFAFEQRATMELALQLISVLGAKTEANTQRYADAAVGNRALNAVAKPGQRLKSDIMTTLVIIVIVVLSAVMLTAAF